MRYRQLGDSDLNVSEISLGSWLTYGGGVGAGKARYIGFSEWPPDWIRDSLELSRERGLEKFVSSQPQYSMLWREPEHEVIPVCRENGISQIVWSPLAQGALTGKYKPG